MVYLYYNISWLRYTILVRNPRYVAVLALMFSIQYIIFFINITFTEIIMHLNILGCQVCWYGVNASEESPHKWSRPALVQKSINASRLRNLPISRLLPPSQIWLVYKRFNIQDAADGPNILKSMSSSFWLFICLCHLPSCQFFMSMILFVYLIGLIHL